MSPVIGVLALQGAFGAHRTVLADLGAASIEVRTPDDLRRVDSLLMPGGESSTMSQLLESSGLFPLLHARVHEGMPLFGTCAGLILMATEILDGRPDQRSLGVIDATVRRNAYGRQVDSFEADVQSRWGALHAVFIRAPRIERLGPGVEVLASYEGEPVLVSEGNAIAATFHPELSGDSSIHEYFVEMTEKGAS